MTDSFHTPPYTERRVGNLQLEHVRKIHEEAIAESRRIRDRAIDAEALYLAFSSPESFFFPLPLEIRRSLHRFVVPYMYGSCPPPRSPPLIPIPTAQDVPCAYFSCFTWSRLKEMRGAIQCQRCQRLHKCCESHRRTLTPEMWICKLCGAGHRMQHLSSARRLYD